MMADRTVTANEPLGRMPSMPSVDSHLDLCHAERERVPLRPQKSTSTRRYVQMLLLGVLAGLLVGLQFGTVMVYTEYHNYATDCAKLHNEPACEAWGHSKCNWNANLTRCVFPDFKDGVDCQALLTMDECAAVSACVFDEDARRCSHTFGYSAAEIGVLAAAPEVGMFAGPLVGAALLAYLPYRLTAHVFSVVLLLSCALATVGRVLNSVSVASISRVLMGCGAAGARGLIPLLAFEWLPKPRAAMVSSVLQPCSQMATAASVLYGYLARPEVVKAGDPNTELRIHIMLVLTWAVAIGFCVAAFCFVEDPAVRAKDAMRQSASTSSISPGPALPNSQSAAALEHHAHGPDQSGEDFVVVEEPLWRLTFRHIGIILVGCCGAAAFVFTGYGTLSNFGPVYAKELYGVEPLLLPLIFGGFAVFGDIVVLVVRRWLPARPTILVGTFVTGVALLIIGIPALPGVASKTVRHVLAHVGTGIFFIALEMCIGSTIFELAVSIMPPRLRELGSGIVGAANSASGVASTLPVPVIITALSQKGTNRRGFGIVVIFYAACAFAFFGVMAKWMHPWADDEKEETRELEVVGSTEDLHPAKPQSHDPVYA